MKKKLGLALSSGAARGVFITGVLSGLEKEGIEVDLAAGASVGFLPAIGIGMDYPTDFILDWTRKVHPHEYIQLDWTNKLGFLKFERMRERVRSVIGDIEFKNLKKPLAAVATDMESCETIVIKEGKVIDALTITFSLPGLYSPTIKNKRILIDGGTTDPLPVDIVRDMGADVVLAINVGSHSKFDPVKDRKLNILEECLCHIIPQEIVKISDFPILYDVGLTEHSVLIDCCLDRYKPDLTISIAPFLQRERLVNIPYTKAQQYIPKMIAWGQEAAHKVAPKLKRLLNYETN